jgi:hypothetical protein
MVLRWVDGWCGFDAIGFEGTNEGMGFQEIDLDDVGRLVQQAFEIAQAPGSVMGGDSGGFFQFSRGMLFGQLQQAQHDTQTL